MKIDSSNVGMESARTYQSVKTSYRRFVMKEYQCGILNANSYSNQGLDTKDDQRDEQKTAENETEGAGGKLYTLQDWQNSLSVRANRNIRTVSADRQDNSLSSFRQLTLRYIFELLFGDRSRYLQDRLQQYGLSEQTTAAQDAGAQTTGTDQLQNFFMNSARMKQFQFTEETVTYEQESTAFSTMGTVRTADGREINFQVDVGMSREFLQTFSQDLNLSFTMCDPLVINLDTDVAQLSDQKFFFDIDADGNLDEISGLGAGSGYLALDRNGDGVINDGSELFGTSSGNGFADLAAYDEDGNGWIDENDAVWSKLKIWTKDASGNDVLLRLADKGVGAICLQHADTDFTLQGADRQTQGAIRKTGVFLYENGQVGTIQHVDVAKYEQGA